MAFPVQFWEMTFLHKTYLVKKRRKESGMVSIDPALLSATAALVTAIASLIWAVRRNPKDE